METTYKKGADGTVTITTTFKPEGDLMDQETVLQKFDQVVSHVSIGRDETTTAIRGEGYRETMCGTISFYNSDGERLHTIYSACAPEYGKKTFDSVLSMEIERVKAILPAITMLAWRMGQRTTGLIC